MINNIKGDEAIVNELIKQQANGALKHMIKVRSQKAEQFIQKMSELILQADSKEKANLLADKFFEMIFKNVEFEVAESMLDDMK